MLSFGSLSSNTIVMLGMIILSAAVYYQFTRQKVLENDFGELLHYITKQSEEGNHQKQRHQVSNNNQNGLDYVDPRQAHVTRRPMSHHRRPPAGFHQPARSARMIQENPAMMHGQRQQTQSDATNHAFNGDAHIQEWNQMFENDVPSSKS